VAFIVKKAPAEGVGGTRGPGLSGRPELVKWGQSPAGRYFTKHITHREHYRSTAGRAVALAKQNPPVGARPFPFFVCRPMIDLAQCGPRQPIHNH